LQLELNLSFHLLKKTTRLGLEPVTTGTLASQRNPSVTAVVLRFNIELAYEHLYCSTNMRDLRRLAAIALSITNSTSILNIGRSFIFFNKGEVGVNVRRLYSVKAFEDLMLHKLQCFTFVVLAIVIV